MLVILLASIIGIILGLYLRFYLSIVLYFFLIIASLFCKKYKLKIIILIICSLIFNIYTNYQIHKFDTKYQDGEIASNYKIISYREEKEYYDKYIAKNDTGDKFLIYIPHSDELKKGTKIYAKGEYQMPDKVRNTGGFNYRRYLNSQKIFGSVYIKNYEVVEISKFNLIYMIQDDIYQSLARLFPKNEMGLILGMMIGETKYISEDILNDFKNTGITHLLAVSGSNVVFVVLMVEYIFKKFIGKRATYFVSIFFLIIFMLISGASASVARATIMMILVILANIFYLKSDTSSNISFSALVLLIINPLTIYDVGFILSFGGTIGIVLFSKDFERLFKRFGKLSETLSVTVSAQLVLTPIMLYYFNTFSIFSIITNLIVVPISGMITIFGFFIYIISKISFPLAKFLSNSLYVLVRFPIAVSNIFSKISFSNIQVVTPNFFEIILFYIVIWCLMKKIPLNNKTKFIAQHKEYRYINKKVIFITVIIFILLETMYYKVPRNYVDIRIVDVGQGDCIYIKTDSRKNILIDGGGSERSSYDVGENILIPYLLDMRVNTIDLIISSHSDADHLDGLITVLEKMNVKKFVIAKGALGYDKAFEIAKRKNVQIIEVTKGDMIEVGNVKFTVISPEKRIDNSNVNEYSLVVKMIYKNKSMLFTGDIGESTENILTNVKSDILKVGHHGSIYSSSEKFIKKVNPDISVISVGKNNSFGHPAEIVVDRLKRTSKVYMTSKLGEIKIKMYKDKIKLNNF